MKRSRLPCILSLAIALGVLPILLLAQPPGGGPRPGFPPPGGPPRGGPPPGERGPGGPPGGREHTANEAEELDLEPANRRPPADNEVSIEVKGEERAIDANGIPAHRVGRFPNRSNPNSIEEQDLRIRIPVDSEVAAEITPLGRAGGGRGPGFKIFGITLDGVLMEPGTAEVWRGRRDSGWNYEALGGAVPLGLDENYGHVQPTGLYHYHGIPRALMERLGYRRGQHSPLIGWAADGFPIYALFGYRDPQDPSSGVAELETSFRLREGDRPPRPDDPGGTFDGAFVQDYRFVSGAGDLDECNGRFCVTPEFPEGTYAYFLTREWPVIPRAFRGTPEEIMKPGEGRGHPGRGHPGRGGPGRGGPGFPPPRPR